MDTLVSTIQQIRKKQVRSPLDVQIRWLIRRDMAEVLRIEQESFEFSWTEEVFLSCLRQRNCIGMVVEDPLRSSTVYAGCAGIVGYMVYELYQTKLRILNFAVSPDVRRRQVGTQMVQKLFDKLSEQRRTEIVLEVRESNLPAQLFFRRQGFRATSILHSRYDDTTEDAYVMQYTLKQEKTC